MSAHEDVHEDAQPEPTPQATTALEQATSQLRERPLPRAVEIADSVLARVLAAPRRSVPVNARPPHDGVRVSSTAITTVVRADLDLALSGAAVRKVALDVDDEGDLAGLTVELLVRFGTHIPGAADLVRDAVGASLVRLLGPEDPASAAAAVPVTITHVHVGDVTIGDPRTVDPGDEQLPGS